MATDYKEMNKALIEHFLSLHDSNYQVKFTRELSKNPLVAFKVVFQYYTEHYGSIDGDNWLDNKQRMKSEWYPNQGFRVI